MDHKVAPPPEPGVGMVIQERTIILLPHHPQHQVEVATDLVEGLLEIAVMEAVMEVI